MADDVILQATVQHNNFRKNDKEPSHVLYKTKNVQDANGKYTDEKVDNVVKLSDGTRVDIAAWVRETKTGKQSVHVKVTKFNEGRPNQSTFDDGPKAKGFEDVDKDIPF